MMGRSVCVVRSSTVHMTPNARDWLVHGLVTYTSCSKRKERIQNMILVVCFHVAFRKPGVHDGKAVHRAKLEELLHSFIA